MYLWLILSKINHLVKLLSSEQHLDDLQTNILFCNLSGWNCDCYDHQLRWEDWDLKQTWCVARWCRSWQRGARIRRCPKPISVLARGHEIKGRVGASPYGSKDYAGPSKDSSKGKFLLFIFSSSCHQQKYHDLI
jgi:hypothetical protein